MTVFQDHLCNDPTERFLQPNPHIAVCFLGVYTNPPPPVPLFLLPLTQYPKEIAGSDITNCLTHTMYFKAKLCRHWKFELILSRAETYHVFLKLLDMKYQTSPIWMQMSNCCSLQPAQTYNSRFVEKVLCYSVETHAQQYCCGSGPSSSQRNSLLEVRVRWESGGTCTTHLQACVVITK